MRTLIAALAGSMLLAGAGAAKAEDLDLTRIADRVERVIGSDAARLARERVEIPRQYEHDVKRIPLGTSEWWQQYDRERGGRR